MENVILIIFFLSIESSYLENIEREIAVPGDTIQFLLVGDKAWRVKTYSMDYDVHVWEIGSMNKEKFHELAVSNTEKNYGDVLLKSVVLESSTGYEGLKKAMAFNALPSNLEISKSNEFAFWVPMPDVYSTKSTPQ